MVELNQSAVHHSTFHYYLFQIHKNLSIKSSCIGDNVKCKHHVAHLPMHSSPVLSRELPVEHRHTKDPWLFLQSALIQGLDSHSSTSVGHKNKVWDSADAAIKSRCAATREWTDPRKRPSRGQSEIPWDTGRWNSPVCSCTDHFHTAACSSDTHRYLKAQTETVDNFPGTCFWYWGHMLKLSERTRILWNDSPTNTVFPCQVYFKTFIAGAFIRPHHVLTHSILADLRVKGTLVNICKSKKTINLWTRLWGGKTLSCDSLKCMQQRLISRQSVF